MEQKKREKKEKKEESNKVKVLRLLLIFVVFVFVVAYFSGAWNPFKSQEVSEEATALYEKSEETMKDIYDKVDKVNLEATGEILGTPDIFKPGGKYPYGFYVEDYGKEGNDEGIQKYMQSMTWEIKNNFGCDLEMYYMINEDYAKEKYINLQNSFPAPYDKFKIDGGEIAIGEPYGSVGAYIVVLQGTVVYEIAPFDNEDYAKSGNFMDLLGIDFEFPAHEDLWQGYLNKKK